MTLVAGTLTVGLMLACGGAGDLDDLTTSAADVLQQAGEALPTREDFDRSMQAWVGRTEKDFVMKWGTPQSQVDVDRGGHVSEWTWKGSLPIPYANEQVGYTPDGTRVVTRTVHTIPFDYACTLRLEVSKRGDIVAFTHDSGLGCIGEM